MDTSAFSVKADLAPRIVLMCSNDTPSNPRRRILKRDNWPKTPTVYVGDDEIEIVDDSQHEVWLSKLSGELDGLARSLSWKYEIGDTALSQSSEFGNIIRAKVNWITDAGVYEGVEVLWEMAPDAFGRVSAPIEDLSREPSRPFAMTGETVFFSGDGAPEWIRKLSDGANDKD